MQQATLENARAEFDGHTLSVTTGRYRRIWHWTGYGLLTRSVALPETGHEWIESSDDRKADWNIPVREELPPAEIVSLTMEPDDDEGFTSEHLSIRMEISCPDAEVDILYRIWVYPEAPGLRTQLAVRWQNGYAWSDEKRKQEGPEARLQPGYCTNEYLPCRPEEGSRRMIGYHSDTQNRNDVFLDLLHEQVDTRPLGYYQICEWANAVCVERDSGAGQAMVKESHKCVNQKGVDTGAFRFMPGLGMESNGWGIRPYEIRDHWRFAWASWSLAYADLEERETAFKRFDRLRYPLKDRDRYVQSNTWGSAQGFTRHRDAAGEASVMEEIEACADIGIDVLQIDDGWEGDTRDSWTPAPPRYPDGWDRIREHAARKGVQLGLWAAAEKIPLEALRHNRKQGGFVSYKLDFAEMTNHERIETLIQKVRAFIRGEDHQVSVNWDLTEVIPRFGFYFAREYGCIYLSNRKPCVPQSTIYRPETVLRDLWDLSRYTNLLKFQGSVQNIEHVDKTYSGAWRYSQDYCLAITLMSSPLFFCEMKYFTPAQRKRIGPLLEVYKQHRKAMFEGIVYPVGEKPDATHWTGFQCHREQDGYLTLFREPDNEEDEKHIPLRFLKSGTIRFENLMTGEIREKTASDNGAVSFTMSKAGHYLFLRYS